MDKEPIQTQEPQQNNEKTVEDVPEDNESGNKEPVKPSLEDPDLPKVDEANAEVPNAIVPQDNTMERTPIVFAALPPEPSDKTELNDDAKKVQADILALSIDNLTAEDAQTVADLRSAFDALDQEQKALLTEELANLEAAEAKIAELQQTRPSGLTLDVPKETCTVIYKEHAENVSYTVSKDESDVIHIDFVIEKEATGNLTLELSKVIQEAKDVYYVPGDIQRFQVTIQNNSDTPYQYKDGSFVLSTANNAEYGSLDEGALLPLLGYDGQYIPIMCVGSMLPKYFYEDLFDKGSLSAVTFEDMCQIFETLEEKGYTGSDPLADYMLDYLNQTNGTMYTSFTELYEALPQKISGSIFASGSTSNGIFTMTEQALINKIEQYPWINQFLYVEPSGNNVKVQIKWPSSALANISYSFFYQYLFHFAFGEGNIGQLKPTSNSDVFTMSHTVAAYTQEQSVYEEANAYFQTLFADNTWNDGGKLEFPMAFALNGPLMGNSYQNYPFSWYNVIELEPVTVPVPTGTLSGTVFDDTTRDDTYTAGQDGTLSGSVVTLQAVWDGDWHDFRSVTTGADGFYTFTDLEAGTYRVTATTPAGMNRTCAMTWSDSNPAGNRFFSQDGQYATGEIVIAGGDTHIADAGFYYYKSSSSGNHNGGNGTEIPDTPTPLGPGLNKDDHFAYIIGYPDGNVRPTANIPRQEVATIFFRLLTDDSRTEAWSTTNSFDDVKSALWSNNAISTMANAGIVTGYEDGSFRPTAKITRAEFAAIAARFESSLYVGDDLFSDISGHWAAEYINRAAQKGWISGYPDGTFRPDQYITRAEAMTLVNNVLDRRVKTEDMLDDMIKWPDNATGAWYYEAVQEATNSHNYDREDPTQYETWTEITAPRDWAKFETQWATAAAAAFRG